MDNTKNETEYRGYVKNTKTGKYEGLFTTTVSPFLAKARAVEQAIARNQYIGASYDTEDVLVKQRKVVISYGNWMEVD